MKIALAVILFTLINIEAKAQKDFIEWNKNVRIDWSDFKGKVDTKSPFAAASAVGIYYKYNSVSFKKSFKVRFIIEARFDKTKSWSKRSQQTKAVLQHEQLHFDIAEVVSRSFNKEAKQTVYSNNYKNEISRMFGRYTNYLQKLQRRYDDQTFHSNNKQQQKYWEKLIHQELLK